MHPPASEFNLELNVIYAVLLTLDPGKDWHWALYLHHPHEHYVGYQMDIANESGTWVYRRFSTQIHLPDPGSTPRPAALCKIGRIEDEDWDIQYLEYYLEAIPLDGISSSKAWFGRAVRVLDETGFFLRCDDVDALRSELVGFARAAEGKDEVVVSVSACAGPVVPE